MSNPQNILSKYRTYSYHHILIACDNEAAANFIRNSNSLSTFRDLSSARPVTIAEEDKKVTVDETNQATGEVEKTEVGNYVVVLNGMIDTSFVVKEVEWFSATAARTDVQDAFTSLAVEGRMTIQEPRGVRFLNALNGACDLLQSDPTGVIWLLKTIFVGHNDAPNGQDPRTEYITDLLPLEFMMYDVTGAFSIEGGLYEISFAGVNNGASRFPQFSRIGKAISVPLGPPDGDGTLQTALGYLERRMNEFSERNRNCVIKALQDSYPQLDSDSLKELNNFRKVEYRVILDDPAYADPEYKIDTLTGLEKDVQDGEDGELTEKGGGTIKPGPQATVEQVIRNIMNRSKRVQKDRTEGDEDGIKYIFKIHSEITMVGQGTTNPLTGNRSDKDIILVVYRIRRHAELTNQTVERVLAGDQGLQGESEEVTKQRIEENTITFDYIFTGKNTDILDFDLKMDMGLAFLQTVSSTNNIGSGTYQIAGTETTELNTTTMTPNENNRGDPATDSEGEKKPAILIRSKTPIFPATNINNVFTKNIRGAHDNTLFHSLLSRHAALESVEAKLSIHGNPYLMSQTNRKPSDNQRKGNTSDPGDYTRIMQNWETMPGLAKVNIYMPETNDTPSSQSTFRRERFWYNGHYYIYGIDHKFSDGLFTQDLHMLALPNESLVGESQQTDISPCWVQKQEGQTDAAGSDDQKETAKTAIARTQRAVQAAGGDDPGGA